MRGIVVLLLIALLFAGCTQPGDRADRVPVVDPNAPQEEPEDETETEEEAEPEDNGNETEESDNEPPTATLSAAADSNNSLLVVFDLSGADPDNDTLTWTLDVGANGTILNGTELPASVNHTYPEAGNYTVTLTVSDGELEGNASVTLELSEGGGGAVQTASASWGVGPYGCGQSEYPSHEAGQPTAGVFYGEVALEAGAPGVNFEAVFTYDQADAELLGGGVQFFNDAGESLGADFGDTITGVVPNGAAVAVFGNCGPTGASVEFTVDPTIEVTT